MRYQNHAARAEREQRGAEQREIGDGERPGQVLVHPRERGRLGVRFAGEVEEADRQLGERFDYLPRFAVDLEEPRAEAFGLVGEQAERLDEHGHVQVAGDVQVVGHRVGEAASGQLLVEPDVGLGRGQGQAGLDSGHRGTSESRSVVCPGTRPSASAAQWSR